jgi:hypothetical protein
LSVQENRVCHGGGTGHNDADDRKSVINVRLEHMSRTPSAFKQTDVTRALKAIRNAGYSAARVLIGKDGQIDITTTTDGETAAPVERNEWDDKVS